MLGWDGSVPLRNHLQVDITLADSSLWGSCCKVSHMHCPAYTSVLFISPLGRRTVHADSLQSRHATYGPFYGRSRQPAQQSESCCAHMKNSQGTHVSSGDDSFFISCSQTKFPIACSGISAKNPMVWTVRQLVEPIFLAFLSVTWKNALLGWTLQTLKP